MGKRIVPRGKFKDVKFMSAQEKQKVLKDWTAFVESRFNRYKFTKALYNHLIQHCSFIAHTNIEGFYDTYFTSARDTIRFMGQFTTGTSAEYGMDYWLTSEEYSDINGAMCEVMRTKEMEELK